MARSRIRAGAVALVAAAWLGVTAATIAAEASVGIYDFSFAPRDLVVSAGDTVTWRNGDRVNHTATGAGWATGTLTPGDAASVTFDEAGTYRYGCRFHPAMSGTVVVEAATDALAGEGGAPPETDASPAAGAGGGGGGTGPGPGSVLALLVAAAGGVLAATGRRRPAGGTVRPGHRS